jgi:hypothetical protein
MRRVEEQTEDSRSTVVAYYTTAEEDAATDVLVQATGEREALVDRLLTEARLADLGIAVPRSRRFQLRHRATPT